MNKAEEYKQEYFKMDKSKFDYIDENHEKRKIEEGLKLNDEERFFAMEFLRIQILTNKDEKMDRKYFEIRR